LFVAEADTADKAVVAVADLVRQRIASGQLAVVDVNLVGISELAGIFKDDPTLLEIFL